MVMAEYSAGVTLVWRDGRGGAIMPLPRPWTYPTYRRLAPSRISDRLRQRPMALVRFKAGKQQSHLTFSTVKKGVANRSSHQTF